MDSCRIRMDSCRIPMDSYRFVWIPIDFLGILVIPMEFHRIPMLFLWNFVQDAVPRLAICFFLLLSNS